MWAAYMMLQPGHSITISAAHRCARMTEPTVDVIAALPIDVSDQPIHQTMPHRGGWIVDGSPLTSSNIEPELCVVIGLVAEG